MKTKISIYVISFVIICGVVFTGINFYRNVFTYPDPNDGSTDVASENTKGNDNEFGSFTVLSLSGEKITSEILKGHKVNLINIWATYCGPCIKEMPDLDKIDKSYGDKVQVIGFCIDIPDSSGNNNPELLEQAIRIANEVTQVTYPMLIPSLDLLNGVLADIYAVPTSYITDENGKILEFFMGRKSEDDLKQLLEKYL